jgi:nucleotidyltransferase substrate binding protein (TIGR01987 family)
LRVLQALKAALLIAGPSDLERDGTIQRFEFTFEAVWQAGQAFLQVEDGMIARSPRSTLKGLGEAGLLSEAETVLALEMLEDRNRTVHMYIEAVAVQIYQRIPEYAPLLEAMVERMLRRHPV